MSHQGKPGESATPRSRRASEHDEGRRGETVEDRGGPGAPQGGQIDGRQGDQQGTKR